MSRFIDRALFSSASSSTGNAAQRRPGRPAPAAIECLEDRRLLSGYALTDLGTLGGANSRAYAINDSGQITGQADTAGPGTVHAFLYSDGAMSDLGALGDDTNSVGFGIGAGGEVVGVSYTVPPVRGFVYEAGATQPVPGPLDQPMGINSGGVITGYGPWGGGVYYPYTYDAVNGLRQLPLLGGKYLGNALDINDAGLVTGGNYNGSWTGYVYDSNTGALGAIPTLGGAESVGMAINDGAQVAGVSTAANGQRHAFLYDIGTGSMSDLGELGGGESLAYAVNDLKEVVGQSLAADGQLHAFRYRDGEMEDLNALIPSGSGWELNVARGVNDRGQIVGYGTLDGRERAFLLTPSVTVQIQVKSGSTTASVNLASEGVIPVTVFSTATFDARSIDVGSVLFAGAPATGSSLADADGDGDMDLVLKFRTQDTSLRSTYEQLLADDADANGVLDATRQVAAVFLSGRTT